MYSIQNFYEFANYYIAVIIIVIIIFNDIIDLGLVSQTGLTRIRL